MKRYLKPLPCLLSLVMCFALSATASSNAPQSEVSASTAAAWAAADAAHAEQVSIAKNYAYMDLDSASEEMKETILEARKTIIYSQSWVAEGVTGTITDVDGTVTELPTFSELFPQWDMPAVETTSEDTEELLSTASSTAITKTYSPFLRNPSDSYNTSPFCYLTNKGNYVNTTIAALYTKNCNIGFATGGYSLGYATYLSQGQVFGIQTKYSSVNVRASTYSTPDSSKMTVSYEG